MRKAADTCATIDFLPAEEAAFMGGLTFGAKNQFGAGLVADLRASGTTHLVAISGYNVQLITVAAFGCFFGSCAAASLFRDSHLARYLRHNGRRHTLCYPSAIMGSLFLLSKQIGRVYSFDFVQFWAAFFMTLWDPAVLVSPGFALSFGSLLGIAYVAPAILQLFHKEDVPEDALPAVRPRRSRRG
jgi:competence protein ComEC